MKLIIHLATFVILSVLCLSCKKNEPKLEEPAPVITEETLTLKKLSEMYVPGANAKAIVFTTKTPETGYNEFYVALYDSTDGSRLTNGHFDMEPVMDMGSMQHSAPVENTEDTLTTNGYFKTAVIFSMPGKASQWCLNLRFHNHKNGKYGAATLALDVTASAPLKFKSTELSLDNNTSVCVSLISPAMPQVGINDFEIVIHKKINLMDYAPIDDYTVQIEPVMPSMGHGSPNNVHPVLTKNGHYKGKVNFTMTGLWQVKLKFFKNGTLISNDQYFEITL